MKTSFLSFVLFLVSILCVNNLVKGQTVVDSLNNLRIVKTKPNPEYLKSLNKIYLPSSDAELNSNPEYIIPTEVMLEKRYNCFVKFFESSKTDGVNDPIFEVSSKGGDSFGTLYLNLSVLEQLYQEGVVSEQVNLYCKYTDMMFNQN